MYKNKSCTLKILKEAIYMKATKIKRAMLGRVEAIFQESLQKRIIKNGHHMKDIVFKT